MTSWLIVAALFALTVAFKATGPLLVSDRPLPSYLTRVISRLAPALLTALILSQTFNRSHPGLTIDARAGGLLIALPAALAKAPMLLTITLAAAATAGLRLLL